MSTEVGIAVYTTPGTILMDGAMAAVGIAAGVNSADVVAIAVAINSCALSTYGIDVVQGGFTVEGDVDTVLTSLLVCGLEVLPELADAAKARKAIGSLDNAHLLGAVHAGGRGEQIGGLIDSANKLGGIAERATAAASLASAGVDLWDKILDNLAPNTEAHLSLTGAGPAVTAEEVSEPVTQATRLSKTGIAGMQIGMTLSQTEEATGQVLEYDSFDAYCYHGNTQNLDGISMVMEGGGPSSAASDSIVCRISLWSPEFSTDAGTRVGDSEDLLLARFGADLVTSQHEYVEDGTYYDLYPAGTISESVIMQFTVEVGVVASIHAGFEECSTLVEGCL